MNFYMFGRVLKILSGCWYDYWINILLLNIFEWKVKMVDLVVRFCVRESVSVDIECF